MYPNKTYKLKKSNRTDIVILNSINGHDYQFQAHLPRISNIVLLVIYIYEQASGLCEAVYMMYMIIFIKKQD